MAVNIGSVLVAAAFAGNFCLYNLKLLVKASLLQAFSILAAGQEVDLRRMPATVTSELATILQDKQDKHVTVRSIQRNTNVFTQFAWSHWHCVCTFLLLQLLKGCK